MTAPRNWFWTENRYKLAALIAEGKSYKEAGELTGLHEGTIKNYMNGVKEFREYVDKITLDNELITRAGASRLLLRIIEEKLEDCKEDKDTVLNYLKYLHEMNGEGEKGVTELKVTFK